MEECVRNKRSDDGPSWIGPMFVLRRLLSLIVIRYKSEQCQHKGPHSPSHNTHPLPTSDSHSPLGICGMTIKRPWPGVNATPRFLHTSTRTLTPPSSAQRELLGVFLFGRISQHQSRRLKERGHMTTVSLLVTGGRDQLTATCCFLRT